MKKSTTRDEITETAKKLFLNKGMDNVGMREIAAELKISVGNLTYHFKKKEDLAEEVMFRLSDSHKPLKPCNTLSELDDCIVFSEKFNSENAFYFKNYACFSRQSEKIRKRQLETFNNSTDFWKETFLNLNAAELILPEGYGGQYQTLAHNLHFTKIYWQDRLDVEQHMGLVLSRFRTTAWEMIFPILTDKGKNIYLTEIIDREEKSR